MKKILIATLLLSLVLLSDASAHVIEETDFNNENEKSVYSNFMTSILSKEIFKAINTNYNLGTPKEGGFQSDSNWVSINRGSRGNFIVDIIIRPQGITHYDKLTFSLYPHSIRQGRGIELLNYQKDIQLGF